MVLTSPCGQQSLTSFVPLFTRTALPWISDRRRLPGKSQSSFCIEPPLCLDTTARRRVVAGSHRTTILDTFTTCAYWGSTGKAEKMGGCMSSNSELAEQKKRSQAIDKGLEEDQKKLRRECKILLLGTLFRPVDMASSPYFSGANNSVLVGSGESGKSTIVKQMKIIHLRGYSEEELYNYRPTVFKNLIECAKSIITAMRQFEIEPENETTKGYCDYLLEVTVESGPQAVIDPKVGAAVQAIWGDPCRTQLMERQTEFYLMDSAE